MTPQDLMRLALEAGFDVRPGNQDVAWYIGTEHSLNRLADLLASACPDCEYHKQRAALWRHEAYRLGGTPLPWDADVAIAKAVEAEQYACVRAASIALLGADKSLADRVVNAIRSRGHE